MYEFLLFNPSKRELILKKNDSRVMATFLNFLLTVTKTMMKVKISFGFKINPQRDIQWFDKCQKLKLYQSKRNCDKNKKNEALRKL